jgi:hypothetical protein
MMNIIMLCVVLLSIIKANGIILRYHYHAQYHYTDYRYAESHTSCNFAKRHHAIRQADSILRVVMLSVIMLRIIKLIVVIPNAIKLSIIMLIDITPSVVMLSVVAPARRRVSTESKATLVLMLKILFTVASCRFM